MTKIVVRVWHKHYADDMSSHIEEHLIPSSKLCWWKQHSGNGSFDLLSWTVY
jgi:hypothetical protein